ncbi:hypothetical protein KP509_05G084200 [Ceratopteris richardii]|uniref:Cytochrome b561 and DOMON domain-containing protein n=1 Tax=Ceratopteris richardii TaxID=49495 RepID=A0A8T2V0B1_CERRI|nr:hypothetical protein KP509_05G084200 [Ceratopteris richardii]
MARSVFVFCGLLTFITLFYLCRAQQCSTSFTFNGSSVNFAKCASLPTQKAMLAWTFYENNLTLTVGFTGEAPSTSGWVGWGINPLVAGQMVGSSVLIAFTAENGSNVLPYKLTDSVQALAEPLRCSPVDIVIESTAVEIQGASMSIFAALKLPSNKTVINHIWNGGPNVKSYQPQEHGLSANDLNDHTQIIDVYTAQSFGGGSSPHHSLKRTHGILNTLAWGIILPLGAIVGRYMRQFTDSIWFYIHVPLQILGYTLGVIGWALGMRLRAVTSASHKVHQNIGIALFVLATIQVLALVLRPSKDHKIRRYWNYYHHSIGYAIVLLSIINIFEGLHILNPETKWKSGYIAILVLMAVVSVVLEVVTWVRYIRKRREDGFP